MSVKINLCPLCTNHHVFTRTVNIGYLHWPFEFPYRITFFFDEGVLLVWPLARGVHKACLVICFIRLGLGLGLRRDHLTWVGPKLTLSSWPNLTLEYFFGPNLFIFPTLFFRYCLMSIIPLVQNHSQHHCYIKHFLINIFIRHKLIFKIMNR